MKKIIFIFSVLLLNSVYGLNSDSINLNSTIEFACEISWDVDPIASNLDITTNQSHLYIGRLNVQANDQVKVNYDLPHEEKLIHNSMTSQYFSFTSVDIENSGSYSGTANFPLSGLMYIGNPGNSVNFWQDHFLNYTGVPALSLVQGVYSATWYTSCATAWEPPHYAHI